MKSRSQRSAALACAGIAFILTVMSCGREREKERAAPSDRNSAASTVSVLATIAPDEQPVGSAGPSGHGGLPTDQGRQVFNVIFGRHGGVAYAAQRDGTSHVVFNGVAGRRADAVGDMAVSPDGRRVAYGFQDAGRWRMAIDGTEGTAFDDVGSPVFSPDSKHVAYEARRGRQWHVVVDGRLSPGCESYYEKPVFSADSSKVVLIENTRDVMIKRFIVSDLLFSDRHVREFRGRIVVFSPDNTRIAAVEELPDGKRLLEFRFAAPKAAKQGPFYDEISYVSLGEDGVSTAYAAERGQERLIVLNGREERLPEGEIASLPVIRPDGKGAGVFIGNGKTVSLHQAFLADRVAEKPYDAASDLVYSGDSRHRAYAARRGKDIFIVVDGKEGPPFDIVVSPRFSPDGATLVYRARKDGRRFVVVADARGRVISRHPGYDMVFDTAFTADGKAVAYGVKDGSTLAWKVERLKD